MRYRRFINYLLQQGCVFRRHGKRHDIYFNPATNATAPVERHTEVEKHMVRIVCKQLGVPVPSFD